MTSQWHRVNFGFPSTLESVLDFTPWDGCQRYNFPSSVCAGSLGRSWDGCGSRNMRHRPGANLTQSISFCSAPQKMFPVLIFLDGNEGRKDIFKRVTYQYETDAQVCSGLESLYQNFQNGFSFLFLALYSCGKMTPRHYGFWILKGQSTIECVALESSK